MSAVPTMAAEVVDRAPVGQDEIDAKWVLLYEQARQLVRADVKVTCPCGFNAPVAFAFQCFECEIWFCRSCAGRHFGMEAGADG